MEKPDPANYQQQLEVKLQLLREQFTELTLPEVEVFESEPMHFRMRAEFRIWHENGQAHYAMNKPGEKRPFIIDDFPIGSKLINNLMPVILSAINQNKTLSHRLFSIEFLTILSGEALVTLIYHKPLDEQWQSEAQRLSDALNSNAFKPETCTPGTYRIGIIGRSRKQKVVLDKDFVTETLTVDGRQYRYQQVENGFTQPNAKVNEKMLTWALKGSRALSTKKNEGDLLELYCGNGNFTCVLAQNFEQVLATEVSKISVRSAQHNFAANQIDNITVVRMSSEEFTQALNNVRPFRRLKDIDLSGYNFSTIFVDPPRAGLDDATLDLVGQFDNIIYISCNPDSLKANLDVLTKTHQINKFAVFDQFPYTHHLECGVILSR